MSLLGFVFLVNVIALVYLTICRLVFFCKVRKARKAFLKARRRRFAIYRSSSANMGRKRRNSQAAPNELNQA